MPDLTGLWTAFVNNPLIQLSVRLAGLYVLALYLAMVFWTVRDAQQRTENQILPYLAGLMVVVLNIFGLFLYLIVRPKETLGEAYERQLAEESLLAEAEQRVVCPTCKERVQDDFILCPTCRTRLKRVYPPGARRSTTARDLRLCRGRDARPSHFAPCPFDETLTAADGVGRIGAAGGLVLVLDPVLLSNQRSQLGHLLPDRWRVLGDFFEKVARPEMIGVL